MNRYKISVFNLADEVETRFEYKGKTFRAAFERFADDHLGIWGWYDTSDFTKSDTLCIWARSHVHNGKILSETYVTEGGCEAYITVAKMSGEPEYNKRLINARRAKRRATEKERN